MKNLIIGMLIMVVLYFVAPPVITVVVAIGIGLGTIIGALLPFAGGIFVIGVILWMFGKIASCFTKKESK